MPANLTPEYFAAEEKFRQAQTADEKIEALEGMLSAIPKHKGTEKMQGDIKRRISLLKKEKRTTGGRKSHVDPYHIPREGAGQVVLVGPPNTGKSSLVDVCTHASPNVAPFPYSTHHPTVGMMHFEDIQIQLVDTAPITRDYEEPWVYRIIRNADVVAVVLDLSGEITPIQFQSVREVLIARNIHLAFRSYPGPFSEGKFYRRAVMLGSKLENEDAELNLTFLREHVGDEFPIVAFSLKENRHVQEVGRLLYDSLHILRVYSKPPGKPVEKERPFILPKGSTVLEMAREVHQDFVNKLAYAKIWGSSVPHDGQMVQRDHILLEGDTVELHLK